MRKDTKQIIQSNFTLLVMELEEAIKNGYTVVKEGDARPYHMIMGNFQVTVEKEIEDEVYYPVESGTGTVVVDDTPAKPVQRGPKPKK